MNYVHGTSNKHEKKTISFFAKSLSSLPVPPYLAATKEVNVADESRSKIQPSLCMLHTIAAELGPVCTADLNMHTSSSLRCIINEI